MDPVKTRGFLKYTAMAAALSAATLITIGCSNSSNSGVATASVLPAAGEESRAEFVATISDYFSWSHQSQYNDIWKVPVRTFADSSATDEYGKQIENAYEENIIAPDSVNKFYPNNVMTRQDAAVIFAKAFYLTLPTDTTALKGFTDASSISSAAAPSVAALVAGGFMSGRTSTTFAPSSAITTTETQAVISAFEGSEVMPVQAMPKQSASYLTMLPDDAGTGTVANPVTAPAATVSGMLSDVNYAPRRFIHLWTPTPDATIYYTTDGSDPRSSSTRSIYDVEATGHIQELVGDRSGAKGPEPYRLVLWKTVAIKAGLAVSPVRTFRWNLYRPWESTYRADVIEPGNFDPAKGVISPKVTRMCSDYESVRAMSWLIEGPAKAIVFDALQTPFATTDQTAGNLYDKAASLTSKPLSLVVGHAHGDHYAQTQNFLTGGCTVYANKRSWSGLANQLAVTGNINQVQNIDMGDTLDIGTAAAPCKINVYALPGHENSLVMLHFPACGYLFSTDIYGCTRMGTADNVAVSGAKVDVLLSCLMQVHTNMLKDGGKCTTLFTGHDESPLPWSRALMFQQLFQNVIDKQEAACSPTLRSSDAGRARTVLIGNMFTDLYNWAAIGIGGTYGTSPYSYMTSTTASGTYATAPALPTIDYTQPQAHLQYAVLGNIEFTDATLVGTNLAWASDNASFTDSNSVVYPSVPNSYSNMFNPWVHNYTVYVASGKASIGIKPMPMSSNVKSVTVNGTSITPRTETTVAVSNGSKITIVVTAPDGNTTETYTLTVSYVS